MQLREKKKVREDYDKAICINLNPLVATENIRLWFKQKRNLFEKYSEV